MKGISLFGFSRLRITWDLETGFWDFIDGCVEAWDLGFPVAVASLAAVQNTSALELPTQVPRFDP
jgi:hypothetical protein